MSSWEVIQMLKIVWWNHTLTRAPSYRVSTGGSKIRKKWTSGKSHYFAWSAKINVFEKKIQMESSWSGLWSEEKSSRIQKWWSLTHSCLFFIALFLYLSISRKEYIFFIFMKKIFLWNWKLEHCAALINLKETPSTY